MAFQNNFGYISCFYFFLQIYRLVNDSVFYLQVLFIGVLVKASFGCKDHNCKIWNMLMDYSKRPYKHTELVKIVRYTNNTGVILVLDNIALNLDYG